MPHKYIQLGGDPEANLEHNEGIAYPAFMGTPQDPPGGAGGHG